MPEAPVELARRLGRRAALEQDREAGRQPGAVCARLAVHQRRRFHGAVDAMEAQDAVAMGRAAALEGHVDVGEADMPGHLAGERVRAAGAMAPQVDQRPEPVTPGGAGKATRRRVVRAVELARNNLGPVGPGQAEYAVVHCQAVAPGGEPAARGGEIAAECHRSGAG